MAVFSAVDDVGDQYSLDVVRIGIGLQNSPSTSLSCRRPLILSQFGSFPLSASCRQAQVGAADSRGGLRV